MAAVYQPQDETSHDFVQEEDESTGPQINRADFAVSVNQTSHSIVQAPEHAEKNEEEDDDDDDDACSMDGEQGTDVHHVTTFTTQAAVPGVIPFQDPELEDVSNRVSFEEDADACSREEQPKGKTSQNLLVSTSQALESLSLLSAASHEKLITPGHERQPLKTLDSQQCSSSPEQAAVQATDQQIEDSDITWRKQPKHFLILTTSGKPVYTYHGDADNLAGLMALTSALVSVIQAQGDKPGHLLAGNMLLVFLLRGPFILLAASKLGEAVEALQRQLELMYRQILLVVTAGVERILLRNPAYDVRSLLEGVGAVLTSLIHRLHGDATYLLRGLRPIAIPQPDQVIISHALTEAVKASSSYYGVLLVAGGRVIAWEKGSPANNKSTLPPLDAWDLMLLDNFVSCNTAIRLQHGEALCPLCLPSNNPAAFLHTYLHYLPTQIHTLNTSTDMNSHTSNVNIGTVNGTGTERNAMNQINDGMNNHSESDPGIYLALLAPSSDSFHALSKARETLEQQLQSTGVLQRLYDSLQPQGNAWVSIESLPTAAGGGPLGCTPLWHFLARFPPRRQVVASEAGELFSSPANRQQLAIRYGRLYSLVADFPEGGRPNKMVWLADEQAAMLAVLEPEVELYMVLDPLTDKSTAVKCADQLRKHLTNKSVQTELLRVMN